MDLKTQIISFLFSFVFGIIFSICTNLNYRFLFTKKLVFKILITIIYVIDFSLLYFLIMQRISYGMIHVYFFLAIGMGYLVGTVRLTQYVNSFKQKIKKMLKKCKVEKKDM